MKDGQQRCEAEAPQLHSQPSLTRMVCYRDVIDDDERGVSSAAGVGAQQRVLG